MILAGAVSDAELTALPCCLSEAFTNHAEDWEQGSDSALAGDPSPASGLACNENSVFTVQFSSGPGFRYHSTASSPTSACAYWD